MENINIEETGAVKISDDVISIIAGVATTEVEGVLEMNGGITAGITDMLGMKNLSKGVKVELREESVLVDLYIVIKYGLKLDEVGSKVQENVKNAIETMTGMEVEEVNVNIVGVKVVQTEDNK